MIYLDYLARLLFHFPLDLTVDVLNTTHCIMMLSSLVESSFCKQQHNRTFSLYSLHHLYIISSFYPHNIPHIIFIPFFFFVRHLNFFIFYFSFPLFSSFFISPFLFSFLLFSFLFFFILECSLVTYSGRQRKDKKNSSCQFNSSKQCRR